MNEEPILFFDEDGAHFYEDVEVDVTDLVETAQDYVPKGWYQRNGRWYETTRVRVEHNPDKWVQNE